MLSKKIDLIHVKTKDQVVDIFTKSLGGVLVIKLSVVVPIV